MSTLRVVIAAGLSVCACFALSRALLSGPGNAEPPRALANESHEQDARLQAATTAALDQREGAIVVIDPQTGRVRAVVNPRLAFQNAFPPGSTIKPFTALAVLRAGVMKHDDHMRCPGKYKAEDVVDSCSHPLEIMPLNVAEALAHSCNFYFATVGESLNEASFSNILTDFGFGKTTGINAENESAGLLARGKWQTQSPIGEGEFLQVTPIQLVTAYAALFNGGNLFRPGLGTDFTPRLRNQPHISDQEKATLLKGMRGAVTDGTAKEVRLDSLPGYIVGKTGTATQLQGFRTHGWFVGLTFAVDARSGPAEPQLAVVVYLKNAHGSDAAEVARSIFEEFTGTRAKDGKGTYVSVYQVSEKSKHRVKLEDYVRQVVSSEASVEDEPEALKALAVTARTYALKNLGRHQREGYDFCSTTHCQRFESVAVRPALATAVRETAGLVLHDRDQIVESYFSASCGGMTANARTLWGADAPEHLRGVRDSYCISGSHYRWTDTLSAEQLARAFRNDPRTDVGQTIHAISVAKYDHTGRAELVSITGDRRRSINGWDFKLIVGRTLGWNHLKSSRFTVSRSGSEFVFRGGGFGHGLGLCQEGSHAMAQRGHSYQEILGHYFPGTRVSRGDKAETRSDVGAVIQSGSSRQRVSASHFRLTYPEKIAPREAEQLLALLESTRTELLRRISIAGISVRFPNLDVVINETTGDFVGRAGMPAWAAAATRNHQIELQPLSLLRQRRILETTLRHELVHVLIDRMGGGETPRWFTEGLALYLAGEGRLIERYSPESSMSVESVEQALASAKSSAEMRTAYAAAYDIIRELIRREGENKVWKRVAERRYSVQATVAPPFTT